MVAAEAELPVPQGGAAAPAGGSKILLPLFPMAIWAAIAVERRHLGVLVRQPRHREVEERRTVIWAGFWAGLSEHADGPVDTIAVSAAFLFLEKRTAAVVWANY